MITEGDRMLKTRTQFNFPYNWHKYTIGLIVIGGLLVIQYSLMAILMQNAR